MLNLYYAMFMMRLVSSAAGRFCLCSLVYVVSAWLYVPG